ncbi:hypothetical protein H4582DRAFT_1894038 [Lactarius indigo]|nr:hypothetical protein H4582DRAFT_1894038 [Lactarius indigo]
MAHYDIFRHHLAIKYPAYGHALWEPSPGNSCPAVEVGDVGFIRHGRFHRLFNVLLPADDPSHKSFGVPEYHSRLTPRVTEHIISGTLNPNNFCSARVASVPGSKFLITGPDSPTEVSFSCKGKQGAVLSLPIQARCKDTVALGQFGEWITKHIDYWFAWVRNLGLGIDRMEDIILVTGAHRTRSWASVAFPGGPEDGQISFGANVVSRGDIVAINWKFSHEHNRGAVFNRRPDGEGLLEDQCIFIRGFRVARKFVILPRGLKAAAGPSPEGHDYEPDVELLSTPAAPEYRDPLHIVLEYIAEKAPHCDMALIHDNDLILLDGFARDTSLETFQPDMVLRHLRRLEPEVHDVTFGLGGSLPVPDFSISHRSGIYTKDPSSCSKSANTDGDTFRVATLSTIFRGRSPSPTSFASHQSLDWISETTCTESDNLSQSHPEWGVRGGRVTPATKVKIAGQRQSTQEGRGNQQLDNASSVMARKLLQFLADQRSSTQGGWGDRPLEIASGLARENEALIDPTDLDIVRQRTIHTTEIKEGSESKRGLPRYLQAREYRKAAKETLKYVKTVSDRARDATIGQSPAVTVQKPIVNDLEVSQARSICKQLCDELKPGFATLVEYLYDFKTSQAPASIAYNARRAQELLRGLNFIYTEPRTGRDPYHDPYRHPIIQRAIETTWFRNKDDVGVVNHEQFSPMPILVIAITLTVIECCIDEWSDGARRNCSWDDAKFQSVYDSHVSSLVDFQVHRPTSLYQLQCDLLRNAREHAGVLTDTVESSRFPPGALDAVREEDNQLSPIVPPNYDDAFPSIVIDHD